jgi:hypothetical protein
VRDRQRCLASGASACFRVTAASEARAALGGGCIQQRRVGRTRSPVLSPPPPPPSHARNA